MQSCRRVALDHSGTIFSARFTALAFVFTFCLAFALLPSIANAQLDVTAHPDISLTANEAGYTSGSIVSGGNVVSYSSGVNWQITVLSLNPDLGLSTDGLYTKPLSDLRWKLSSSSTWNALTTSDVLVQTGAAGSDSISMDYEFLFAWAADRPGTYGTTVQFTITAT